MREKANVKAQERPRGKKSAFLLAVCILLCVSLTVGAWYSFTGRLSRTDEFEINMPPIIYIKDDNLQEMTSFNLDGLRVGEEYRTVFCVSPAVPDSVNNFFLGLIYTENLGMEISLYPVHSVTDTAPQGNGALYLEREITPEGGSATSCYFNYRTAAAGDDTDGYDCKTTYGNWTNETRPAPGGTLNGGIYKAYRNIKFSENAAEGTGLLDKLNDRRQYRFFVLHITWPEDYDTRTENVKEADIVYIVSKGTRKSNG